MQVCNISFQIEPGVEMLWKQWMKDQFIPGTMALPCFSSYQFYQLEVDSTQAPTYTLQLFTEKMDALTLYRGQFEAGRLSELNATWGEQCFYFNSFMQIVN